MANATGIYRSTLADALLRRQRKVPIEADQKGGRPMETKTYKGGVNCLESDVFVMGPTLDAISHEHPVQLPADVETRYQAD